MHAGLGAERAALDDVTFLVGDRVLVERRLGQVPVDRSEILEAEFVGAMSAVTQTCFLHGNFLLNASRLTPNKRRETLVEAASPVARALANYTTSAAGARPIVAQRACCQAEMTKYG